MPIKLSSHVTWSISGKVPSVQLPLNAESTHSTFHTHIPQLTQPVVKREPPPYGRRKGWVPRSLEDYGDGGAFPEIHIAQYPMNMGKKGNVVSYFSGHRVGATQAVFFYPLLCAA